MAATFVVPLIDNLWYYDLKRALPSTENAFPSARSSCPIQENVRHVDDAHHPRQQRHLQEFANPNPTSSREDDMSCRMQELHRVFDTMDEDHDGELSGSELCAWMKKLGLVFTEEGMVRMVEGADRHKRGTLDFEEFVALNTEIEAEEEAQEIFTCAQEFGCRRKAEEEEENEVAHEGLLHEVFDLFDKDHDGVISPHELRVTLDRLGMFKRGEESQYVDMIKHADSDGDGQVSFSDFQNMMDRTSKS